MRRITIEMCRTDKLLGNPPVVVLADDDHAYRKDFLIYLLDVLVNFTLSKVILCLRSMQA